MITEKIAEFICELKYENIPEESLNRAKYQILSILSGCAASCSSGIMKPLESFFTSGNNNFHKKSHQTTDLKASIFPSGEHLALDDAVYFNTAASAALDFDDYLFMGHTGHSSVLTAIALSEAFGLSTKEMITAMVAGNEIGGRLGFACLLGPLNGQMWSFIHAAISAASASRLMGFSQEKTAHAIAIALSHPPFPLKASFLKSDAKILSAAIPCQMGLNAAFLADKGLKGCLDILESTDGFLSRFSYIKSHFAFSGFNQVFLTETLAYKPYPGCAYLTTLIDSILKITADIRREEGNNAILKSSSVKSINIRCSLITGLLANISDTLITNEEDLLHPVAINFSLRASAALALHAGTLTSEEFKREYLLKNKNDLLDLVSKVKYSSDIGFTLQMLESMEKSFKDFPIFSLFSASELTSIFRKLKEDNHISTPDFNSFFYILTKTALKIPGILENIIHGIFSSEKHELLASFRGNENPFIFPAEVSIKLKDGREFISRTDIPGGGERNKNDFFVVQQKVRQEFGFAGLREKAEEAITTVENLEQKSIKELINTSIRDSA